MKNEFIWTDKMATFICPNCTYSWYKEVENIKIKKLHSLCPACKLEFEKLVCK